MKKKILTLKPTQFAIGMLEVDEKISGLRSKRKEMKRYLRTKVPVVVSPDREYYIIDHHHFLTACYQLGVKRVGITIKKDLSRAKMTYRDFWKWMHRRGFFYPYDQFGEGPRKEYYLPKDVRGLADDPYRSIAWYVRKAGCFKSTSGFRSEFKWANFFRKRLPLGREGKSDLRKALVRGIQLSQTSAARHLPGHRQLNTARAKKKAEKLVARLSKK